MQRDSTNATHCWARQVRGSGSVGGMNHTTVSKRQGRCRVPPTPTWHTQSVELVEPRSAVTVLSGHARQSVAPDTLVYEFLAQISQCVWPAADWNWPARMTRMARAR